MVTPEAHERLLKTRLLVEIGELYDAELSLAEVLEERPDDLAALDLLAKIKHMRGELSEALALWAQVQERSPRYHGGLVRLSSLLQMARDTERGGGEFLALGHFQLWRKPAAHLELEDVFRLFLTRKPREAQERCDQLAQKYRGKDADLFKLSVLAKAWIAELTGELEQARALLEDLGRERGFETDSDRILALARIYEQMGTPEILEKAVHIYEHFERTYEKVSVLGHLAALHHRLGRADEAAQYARRFEELFRRRMHRPTLAEAVRVAATCYVPLQKLTAIRFPDGDSPSPATGDDREGALALAVTGDRAGAAAMLAGRTETLDLKYLADLAALEGRDEEAIALYVQALGADADDERALALAVTGDRAGAAETLAGGTETLDLKYLADLAALEGKDEEAIALYVQALGADDDERVVGWLLGQPGISASPLVAAHFGDPQTARRTEDSLSAAIRAAPVRASLWRQKEALLRILGRAEEADRCGTRAVALEEAAQRRRQPVGRAMAAAVYHFVGKARGLIHEVWAGRKPAERGRGGFLDEILGNLTSEMTQAVRNTFLSVREYARAKWPQQTRDILDHTYTYKVTKEDEPSGGLSAGLPTALAFLSVFLDRPIPQDVASTGVLVTDSHDVMVLHPVGEPEYKVRGAYNRNLERLILPVGNKKDLAHSPLVPPAVCAEIVRYASDLDEAVALVFGEDVFVE